MPAGKIHQIAVDKGFGFIKPEADGPDIFFHRTSFQGRFDTLRVGQKLSYELDESADRPRAMKIALPTRTSESRRQNSTPSASFYGHVIRLHRWEPRGYISPVTGGIEILFEPSSVAAPGFSKLETGQYVRFAVKPETAESKQPVASFVTIAKKFFVPSMPNVARHPRARRKKPSWRGDSNSGS